MQRKRLVALLVKSNISNLLSIDMLADYKPLLESFNLEQQEANIKFEKDIIMKYKEMLRVSPGGYKIVNKRDIDEIYVNNYIKEWIKCWDPNMDIQITLDHFAIITYITDYMLKDDTGTMEFIKKAIKEIENQVLEGCKKYFSDSSSNW